MAKEYNVSGKEIIEEMLFKGNRDDSSHINKGKKKKIVDFLYNYSVGLEMIPLLYRVPSIVRLNREYSKEHKDESTEDTWADILGGLAGQATAMAVHMASALCLYEPAIRKGHPEILLIPVATNIASGIYEAGRKAYEDAEQRVIQNKKDSGLEKKL